MLTEFGKTIRKARIDINETLKSMANNLGFSSAYLGAIEMGRKPISTNLIKKIRTYLISKGAPASNLKDLEIFAILSNEKISLKGMNKAKKLTLATLATNQTTEQQITEIHKLLTQKG